MPLLCIMMRNSAHNRDQIVSQFHGCRGMVRRLEEPGRWITLNVMWDYRRIPARRLTIVHDKCSRVAFFSHSFSRSPLSPFPPLSLSLNNLNIFRKYKKIKISENSKLRYRERERAISVQIVATYVCYTKNSPRAIRILIPRCWDDRWRSVNLIGSTRNVSVRIAKGRAFILIALAGFGGMRKNVYSL